MWWVPTGEDMHLIAGLVVGLAVGAGLWAHSPAPARGRHHRKDER